FSRLVLRSPRATLFPYTTLFRSLMHAGRPIFTAGCVSDFDEQELLLDAFAAARKLPEAPLMVLVPRHPEYADRMKILEQMLLRRSEEHTSELQSHLNLVCRLLLE